MDFFSCVNRCKYSGVSTLCKFNLSSS